MDVWSGELTNTMVAELSDRLIPRQTFVALIMMKGNEEPIMMV